MNLCNYLHEEPLDKKEGWLVKQDEDDMRISTTTMKDGFHCAIGESVRAAKLFPAKEIQDAPFSEAATMPNSIAL